jgi:hypothetical protein
MYSLVIAGMLSLLLALFGAAAFIVRPRAARSAKGFKNEPRFKEEFIDEVNRLGATTEHQTTQDQTTHVSETPQKDAYALYLRGEPVSRIASTLRITSADAELLIRIEESLRRNSPG